jgi:DNA-binding SARP family transcriptional activator/tetratricopeptide (TPR) repeat protein
MIDAPLERPWEPALEFRRTGKLAAFGIRMLGELQLNRGDGTALALPASRKTRALLGYLIATGQAHRRERLCDLFWDGPDDPRAELRWCLSKLRPLLQHCGVELAADRQKVGIVLGNTVVDLLSVRSMLGEGVAKASTDDLKSAALLFRGEFLDGLDLPICYHYQEWCMAEREAVSRLRLAVLGALVERLQARPDDALPYARALAVADPLCELGHASVVRLLSRAGRNKDALSHYERVCRFFETELGAPPSDALLEARKALQTVTESAASVPPPRPLAKEHDVLPSAPNTVGRRAENARVERAVAETVKGRAPNVLLLTGEAGIGKSHLLGRIARDMKSAGGVAFGARGFEPEAVRPYGMWIDLLRAMVRERQDSYDYTNLGILLPEAGSVTAPGDRGRLLDAVVNLLRQIVSKEAVAITLDDIQWIDEASSSLLHYVARQFDTNSRLLLVCAGRNGEIEDNAAVSSVLRSLSREQRLQKIELGPLGPEETKELVHLIDPALDGAGIFAESEGNPLFTLELARARQRGDAEPGPTIEAVIGGQLVRLTDHAREVLLWASAVARAFKPEDVGRAARLDDADMLTALEELERRGLIRPVGDDIYDFAHDLVRQATYRTVAQPRRKLLHRHIARAFEEASRRDPIRAADVAYHAARADDFGLAARACVIAGERALRLFANVEAAGFAERGLRHIERLGEDEEVEAHLSLLRLRVLAAAGPGMRPLPPLASTVTRVTKSAEKFGLHAAVATGHYLLSVLHQDAGDVGKAGASTLRAAAAGRATDARTHANQLANTARCLLELETEIDRARRLLRESVAIAALLGLELCELHWARGLLLRWDGDAEAAVTSLARALDLAREEQDRWREYKCLTWLALQQHELGQYSKMEALCAELTDVANRLGEDETPFVATLQALASLAEGHDSGDALFSDALSRLRRVDDKSYLAYALNTAAWIHLRLGRLDQARVFAAEALAASSAMRRQDEIAISRAMLSQVSSTNGPMKRAAPGTDMQPHRNGLSARARAILCEIAVGSAPPKEDSTLSNFPNDEPARR